MIDVLGTLVTAAHHNLLVVVQIALGYTFNVLTHRSREQQRVPILGHTFQDGIDTL